MENPFAYGKEVSGDNFCNRKEEIKELSRDVVICRKGKDRRNH